MSARRLSTMLACVGLLIPLTAMGDELVIATVNNGHMITLYDKGSHIPLMWTHLIPATLEGRALHNVQNAMVAAAVATSSTLASGRPSSGRYGTPR